MRPQTYASLAVEVSKHLSDGPLEHPRRYQQETVGPTMPYFILLSPMSSTCLGVRVKPFMLAGLASGAARNRWAWYRGLHLDSVRRYVRPWRRLSARQYDAMTSMATSV